MNVINNDKTIYVSDLIKEGFSKQQIYGFIHANRYEKVSSGVYSKPDEFVDEIYILCKRCPNGVISHDEALYFYGLIDREPIYHTITVYSGYNASRLKESGYRVFFTKKELLDIGKTTVINDKGNTISIYDLERTIVDLFRNRSSFEIQDFNTALKQYASRKDKDLNKLFEYAKKFRVDRIIINYLGVLL